MTDPHNGHVTGQAKGRSKGREAADQNKLGQLAHDGAFAGETLVPARFWHREKGRIRCDLCPRHCLVSPGQRAFCYIRVGTDDGMALTSYGRSSGFCIDPIEKKPLNHFYPGSAVLSLGTAGCNLGCRFCQNWDISAAHAHDRRADYASPQRIAEAAAQLGCRSVAFTYNDPIIFAEYAIDIAAECRARDIRTVAVTNGYITAEARPEFFAAMDAVNVDLKGFTPEFYRKLCLADLAPVLDTIEWLVRETDTWVELTTLIIPDANDQDAELRALSQWVYEHVGADVPLHFTAFHPDYKMTDRPRTPPATVMRARDIARDIGIHYVYTGNIMDDAGASTWCPGCGSNVISRHVYAIDAYDIALGGDSGDASTTPQHGVCRHCGHAIAGHFTAQPGQWGNRRQGVTLTGA